MKHAPWVALIAFLLAAGGAGVRAGEDDGMPGWPGPRAATQRALEAQLNQVPSVERLRAWHDLFCAEPHQTGTEGDARMIAALAKAFREMGLETDVHEFWAYMPRFESAQLSVSKGQIAVPALPLLEEPVPSDPSVAHGVPPAFNAYSASGDVGGQVVYANYGTKEDFEQLDALGVSCKDRIVVARYGHNFRGYKAKYAEARGAAGLLIYTDPGDSGYGKGLPYPEGGYANASYVQRGSIITVPYPGDPLTPYTEATQDAERLDPKDVGLPKIPVQPIGWGAAQAILGRMEGGEVPSDWQGGLPFRYRLTGGPDVWVRLKVVQPRSIQHTANVLGIVRGATHPDEMVIVGCHFDAWGYGAGDPHAGSIVLFEMARSLATLAKRGMRPARTVVFANWGAEEFGIIGSTEWCEANAQALRAHGVAYVNLDMAAMGPEFNSASGPLLKRVIEDASVRVPQARAPEESVHDAWARAGKGQVGFGDLGGGSDHVGFQCHLGVPSCSLGAGGSRGVSYHSAYDTLAWYRQVVGDYEPALMLARVGNVIVSRLANAPLLPYDVARPFVDALAHVDAMLGTKAGDKHPADALRVRLETLRQRAVGVQRALDDAVRSGRVADGALDDVNTLLLGLERAWLREPGLPGRPWYRNLFAASDPTSGYAAWMLPLLREAHETKDPEAMTQAVAAYLVVCDTLEKHLAALLRLAEKG